VPPVDSGELPRVVRGCDGLGPPGTWENVTPQAMGDISRGVGIIEVRIDPLDPATIYTTGGPNPVGGGGGAGIFKSTDCGANWTKVSTGRNHEILESGWQWSLVIDPTNSQVMYAANGYGGPLGALQVRQRGRRLGHAVRR
jgi:hypothetical protein